MAKLADDGSAQAIIVAAFMIAVGVVVVATLLNAVIFSQNLDARGVQIESDEVAEVNELVLQETEFIMDRVHGQTNTPDEAESYYTPAMENFTEATQLMPSSASSVVRTGEWDNLAAWQFVQNNSEANLDGVDGDEEEWDVVDDSDELLALDFNISLDEGFDENDDNLTRIKLHTGVDDRRQIYAVNESMSGLDLPFTVTEDAVVVEDDDGHVVGSYNSSNYDDFSFGEDDYLEVSVLTGEGTSSINGEETEEDDSILQDQNADEIQSVSIEWGNSTKGTYEVRVDGGDPDTDEGPCANSPCVDTSGWITGMIHSSTYEFTHVHPKSTHTDEITRVHPREVEG